jgi:pimeloyl-ACP methyl ester carboxylesterase
MPITRTLHIEGHTIDSIGYNLESDSIPIIFIHGITASNTMWGIGQTPLIRERYRWYALGLPGHYPSTLPAGTQAYEINAVMLARVLAKAVYDLVGDQPVVLAGHSTGGFAALNLAANARDRLNVAGVFSNAGFAHGRWTGVLGISQWMARLGPVGRSIFRLSFRLLGTSLPVFRRSISLYAHNRQALYAHPIAEPTFAAMYPNFSRIDTDALLLYFRQMPHIDISDDLHQIDVPTLVIAGEDDPIVPPSESRKIAAAVAQAELVMMPDVGHMPMSESGNAYDDIVTRWFQRHFPLM